MDVDGHMDVDGQVEAVDVPRWNPGSRFNSGHNDNTVHTAKHRRNQRRRER